MTLTRRDAIHLRVLAVLGSAYGEGQAAVADRIMAAVELDGPLTDDQATLTSVRVWAEIVRDHNSDEHVRRHMRMLLGLLDGEVPDVFGDP